MGNREDLLAGARQCLLDKGYMQTTARDIANVSGVSLAAIGYHFGTKEKLLQEAMMQANADWSERIGASVQSRDMSDETSWSASFEQVWQQILDSSPEDKRLLLASLEVLANVDKSSSVCESLGDGMSCARNALVGMFGHAERNTSASVAEALGRFYFALDIGVRILSVTSPGCAPSPRDLVVALQAIAPRICRELTEESPEREVAD